MAADPATPKGPIPAAELIRRLIQRDAEGRPTIKPARPRAPFPPVVPQFGAVATGRLLSHGRGSPPHDLGRPSYFVKILTAGKPQTIWGSDLRRAIEESQTNPKLQMMIGVQRVGYQPLKVPKKNGTPGEVQEFRRTRWRVERVEFFAERLSEAHRARESALRQRDRDGRPPPSLPEAVVRRLEQAQEFADRHIYNSRDREVFLAQAKARITDPAALLRSTPEAREIDREPPTR